MKGSCKSGRCGVPESCGCGPCKHKTKKNKELASEYKQLEREVNKAVKRMQVIERALRH